MQIKGPKSGLKKKYTIKEITFQLCKHDEENLENFSKNVKIMTLDKRYRIAHQPIEEFLYLMGKEIEKIEETKKYIKNFGSNRQS